MIADCRLRIAGCLKREILCGVSALAAVGVGMLPGCITGPQNPAATQPATALDPATTQPAYWLDRPAVAQVRGRNFDAVWDVCKETARGYLFALDREDYRSGLITTVPMISRQFFEVWRPDTGDLKDVMANSTATIRRTLRFEVARNEDETFTVTPKVLVERETILERRVTDVSQYRTAFSGPVPRTPPREAVTLSPETYPDIPVKYWYPIGRDTAMERQVAERVRGALEKRQAVVGGGGGGKTADAATKVAGPAGVPLQADGVVNAMGPSGTLYVNVGAGDKVVPGMTFEVYDARATLPTLEGYAANNPQSKGWVEVTSVGNGVSTCRILKGNGGAPPKPGDQIFNFVFDRGRQNHFAVAGEVADRETLTGLIWRWNGVVDERVGTGTNYLILGREPKDGPVRQAYDAARAQAEQLKVPVVGEDRFDLLIRYYDPAKR